MSDGETGQGSAQESGDPPEAGATDPGPAAGVAPDPDPGAPPDPVLDELTVGQLMFEVSDRAAVLIREEVELAKTEVSEKFGALVRGSVVGLAAGIFVVLALAMFMHAFAWFLNDLFFEDTVWLGFLAEAVLFVVIAGAAGLFAYRSVRKGAPPTPQMAMDEAREIKAVLSDDDEGGGSQ